ncbi:carbohydrate kinase [Mycobacterium sp. MYCO198283]|uniref:carbohydrate kinase family protein n=1 Tax=Mycobacterium sp. MYCO198283 TaxID=2883505 RepID=UPI001E353406|nr:carbohydrate kinase [Mycobacterium sp. MYCO198283]MCG5431046.1 carbohydrate kinase [Mycobacterium sp. MYCO198283]
MTRAVVIGEALIDIVVRGDEQPREHVGGSPLNVAVGLARLGRPVDFLTFIGDDERGRRIASVVSDAGASLVAGSMTADRTPTARAVLDARGSAGYDFDIEWRCPDTVDLPPPLLAHTGSIASVLDPGCLAVAALFETYRASATLTFDPNVREALVDNADQARARIERMVARCDVVKASDEDLRWFAPEFPPERIAAAWLATGPSVVAVTRGERGAFAVCAAGTVDVAAPSVDVVDTVGAGDAFMAGLIDALWSLDLVGADRRRALAAISTAELRRALGAAAVSSALTVARAGADLPDRAARDAAAARWAILG